MLLVSPIRKSLTEKRFQFDVIFMYKVLNGFVDAPGLLSKISLAVSPYY